VSGHICPWWLAYSFDNPLRRLFHNPEKMLGPYVEKGMTVLDVGCGMGFFSIGMAGLVGDEGCVIAADLQSQMLSTVKKRSENAGVADRIRTHKCEPDDLGLRTVVDFVLTFWMVHEVPDTGSFFRQVHSCLKEGGKLLVAEPRFHVSAKRFEEIVTSAQAAGLGLVGTPSIRFSRSALFGKNSS
jgi:ubiquinone/menaquinone biosynthesis C-methylase UbiE